MKRAVLLVIVLAAACSDESSCDPTVVGTICTIAGSGENGYGGDEGPATKAFFSLPQDTLTDDDGTIFILDWNNHRIRKVTEDGIIHHVAGRGELGGTLEDPANQDFNHPTGMLFDPSGQFLHIAAWHNSMIRMIDLTTGEIVTTCGDGRRAYFGDEGAAIMSTLDLPASIVWDLQGNLVIMDQANQVIRYVDAAGIIHHLYGQCIVDPGGAPAGPGLCADGVAPTACAPPSGKLVCGDPMMLCSMACTPGYTGDEGPATAMRMAQPFGQSADPAGRMVYDTDGNLYFADSSNSLIRMIDTAGIVHRVAGVAPVGGVAQSGYSGDGGPAVDAKLNNPVDLALDTDGTLYFTDKSNHCVRKIDPAGTVSTVAGLCGTKGFDGDGGPAASALLFIPYGIELVGNKLLISDTGNSVIRQVLLR